MRSSFHAFASTVFLTFVLSTSVAAQEFDNARLTFYSVGLGTCGQVSQDSDFVVALSPAQYGDGSNCGKTVTITANGKTAVGTVVDECVACPSPDLDLSKGLFDVFADESVGFTTGSWQFN